MIYSFSQGELHINTTLFSFRHQWFSCTLNGSPLNGSVQHRSNIILNWHRHTLSPTLSQSLNCALFLVSHLLYSFISCLSLGFPTPSPSPHLQDSRWACKGALIERNINLQVTNSSRGRAGGCVCVCSELLRSKTGTSKAPVPPSDSCWHFCETPQPLSRNHNMQPWCSGLYWSLDWRWTVIGPELPAGLWPRSDQFQEIRLAESAQSLKSVLQTNFYPYP